MQLREWDRVDKSSPSLRIPLISKGSSCVPNQEIGKESAKDRILSEPFGFRRGRMISLRSMDRQNRTLISFLIPQPDPSSPLLLTTSTPPAQKCHPQKRICCQQYTRVCVLHSVVALNSLLLFIMLSNTVFGPLFK